jgi:type IV pilus assembly protein PilF
MMRSVHAMLGAVLGCLVAACAAPKGEGERMPSFEPSGGIGEVRDARSRAKAHTDLAYGYYELGNMSVAQDEVRVAIAADASYAPAYNIQGLISMDLKDNPAAEASFQRGLQLTPQDPDMNHNYGWCLCQTGRVDESLQWFMTAVKNPLYATPSKSYAAAGRCLRTRNPQEAATYFERALRLDPNSRQALLPYADILYQRGQLSQAKTLVDRFHKLQPDPTAESLWLGLRIERKLGDQATANSYAAQLRRRYANSNEYRSLQRGEYE